MLVLSRKLNETVQIGASLVRIVAIGNGRVKLGFDAADDVEILRGELVEQPAELTDLADLAEV